MIEPLLPDNATPLEHELAALSSRIDDIDPSVITTIWSAWSCPAQLLTPLAWALSVDQWDDGWSEIAKRQAIAGSPAWHRIKGTRAAIEQAAARVTDAPATLTEWWETEPNGRRGTSMLHLAIDDPVAAEAARRRVIPLVMAAKPKSRPIVVIAGMIISGEVRYGGALHTTTFTVINSPDYAGEDAAGSFAVGGVIISTETITVETAA